jgi:lipopolysaccharide biosynthesis glycosyltransferase
MQFEKLFLLYFLSKKNYLKMKSKNTYKLIVSFIILLFLKSSFFIHKLIKNNEEKKNHYNYIPVAFSVDNKYLYPLIVLLTSILLNANPSTFYLFYIMIPYNFYSSYKKKILNLSKKYKKCKIKFYNLGLKYIDWSVEGNYSQTVYFRLSLPDLIKTFDKIIYLDCDTMVHKDLTELYQINMKDKYYLGFPGHEVSYFSINGTRNFINTGVILINLKLLREIKSLNLLENYYKSHGTKKVDEYLINVVFYNKISFLPFIYGIPDFEKGNHVIASPSIFWNNLNGSIINKTENYLKLSSINRYITHEAYIKNKWWNREYDSLTEIGKKWIMYASKSNVFNEICKKYIQYNNICKNLK